jgi:hypothetical protein
MDRVTETPLNQRPIVNNLSAYLNDEPIADETTDMRSAVWVTGGARSTAGQTDADMACCLASRVLRLSRSVMQWNTTVVEFSCSVPGSDPELALSGSLPPSQFTISQHR